MTASDPAAQGRESYVRKAWQEAYDQLSIADGQARLTPKDVVQLATAAYLIGRDADSADLWARAFHDYLARGEVEEAAQCARWLIVELQITREFARAGGWLARVERLLDGRPESVEHGFLLLPTAYEHMAGGDLPAALATFGTAAEVGERFGDPDLTTLAGLGRGQTLIMQAHIRHGVAALDEAMVTVTADEASPIVVGLVYCAVIDACRQIFDLRRAREWTTALSRWCAAQPDLVPYRGQCLVHRAEIMRMRGAWTEAMNEARRARDRLTDPAGQPAVGAAFYQLGELHRLRGESAEANEAYRQASQWGHVPQPGQALLRLAQGDRGAAVGTIRRVVDEAEDPLTRAQVLPAFVEIMLSADDVPAARTAADELSAIAAEIDAPMLRAESFHAAGAVTFAEGDPRTALGLLRRAWNAWQALDAPYQAARVRVVLSLACHRLGDVDGAETELDGARQTFELLGAASDLARLEELEELAGRRRSETAGGLTAREIQVLALVVNGRTNREIAAALVISEHTVRRHIQNIFGKIDVSSRAAATAYALQHHLV